MVNDRAPRPALLPAATGEAFIPVEFQGAAYRFGHSHGAAVVPRQPRRRRRQALLRADLRPVAGERARPGRPARRLPGAAPVRRLADVLRLRRRPGQAEQADRHADLDAALRPAARRDRQPRAADRAAAAEPAPPPDLGAALGPDDRAQVRRLCRSRPPTWTSCTATGSGSSARRRSGTTSSRRPSSSRTGCDSGPVGGRIVAEVVVGLLESDPASYLAYEPGLAADAPVPRKGRLPHGRLPHVRGRRPEEPRSVIAPLSATGG